MPYSNENEAKEAGFPTEVDGVALTLEQINHLAEIFDALRETPGIEAPMAAAVARFRELYEVKDGGWVEKERVEARRRGSAEVKDEKSEEVENSLPTPPLPHSSTSFNLRTSTHPHPPTSSHLRASALPHSPTSFSGFVSLSAVSLPDGGVADNVIPGQIILHTGTWRDGEVEITDEILAGMLENHIVLSDKASAPYLEPFVKADHSMSVNDIIGHWENLRVEEVEIPTAKGPLAVTALVGDEVITNPEALEKIKRGEWTRRSAEFVRHFRDEATGEEFDWVLLGSAYVDIPEITSIPPVRVPIAAAATLEEAVVELKRVRGAGCVVRGAEENKKESRENDISENRNSKIKGLGKEERAGSGGKRLSEAMVYGDGGRREETHSAEAHNVNRHSAEAQSVEMRRLREDCENLKRESAKRQEEIRGLRRERRLEELRRPGENGLALPEATIALVREGMERFGAAAGAADTTAVSADGRVRLKRGAGTRGIETHSAGTRGGEVEMDFAEFIVALAREFRDTGLVDTRVLTASDPRRDDGERKAERIARERGYIGEVAGGK